MFWAHKAVESEEHGISLEAHGRAEEDVRGDLQVVSPRVDLY